MLDDESADIANASRPCREGEARNRVARTRDSYPRSRAEIEARHHSREGTHALSKAAFKRSSSFVSTILDSGI